MSKRARRKFIGDIKAPIFLIHSEGDSQIPAEHARILKEANPAAKLWIVDEADHGEAGAIHRAEYETRILEFLVSSMRE